MTCRIGLMMVTDIKRFLRSVLVVIALCWHPLSGAGAEQTPEVDFVGYFTNASVYDPKGDPHISGYWIVLYGQGDKLFGLFYSAEGGMVGDTPNGRIDNVRFESRSKRFSFNAKLSLGSNYDPKTKVSSFSKDFYQFDGVLSGRKIAGTLVHKDGNDLSRPGRSEKIVLRKKSVPFSLPASYDVWLNTQLNNGPQW